MIGDVELKRWNETKGNEALFTALPTVYPYKRVIITHAFPNPWGCNNKRSQHEWKLYKSLENSSKYKLHPFSLKINLAWPLSGKKKLLLNHRSEF